MVCSFVQVFTECLVHASHCSGTCDMAMGLKQNKQKYYRQERHIHTRNMCHLCKDDRKRSQGKVGAQLLSVSLYSRGGHPSAITRPRTAL